MGGTFAYEHSEHFARRIDGFLTADVDPRSQIGYATNAIQEGGFFGVGVGQGQVKWTLPDAHTDFIIAVAAEEYGLILVLVIIALYCTVVVRCLLRLMQERDPFVRLAGTGLACIFGVQAMINIGVAVRLLPAKGMTLPFVSYGGSSVIAAGITVGMLLALTRTRPQGEFADIFKRGPLMAAPLLLIAAGGTGGHMFPAQALAEAMLAKGWRVRLSTDARGARYAGGFPAEVEIAQVSSATFARGGVLGQAAGAVSHRGRGDRGDAARCGATSPPSWSGFGGYPTIPGADRRRDPAPAADDP